MNEIIKAIKRAACVSKAHTFIIWVLAVVLSMEVNVVGAEIEENGILRFRDASIQELRDMGLKYFSDQKMDSASLMLTMAMTKEGEHMSDEDASLLAEVHNALGIINFNNSNYSAAYSHFLHSIKLWNTPDASGYNNLAGIYMYFGDTPRAYECLKKVYKGAISRGHVFHASIAMVNILTLDLDNAHISRDSIMTLIEDLRSVPQDQRDVRGYPVAAEIADAYILSKEGKHVESALRLKNVLGNLGRLVLPARDIHSVYTLIAKEYGAVNMYDSALLYLDRAQNIAAVNDFKELLASTYLDKSKLLSKIGRGEEAERYRIRRLEINDSLFNPQELGKIRDIQMSSEIDSFAKRLEAMKVQERMSRIIIIVISVALMIVVAMMVLIYRKNRQIRDKNLYLFHNKTRNMKPAPETPEQSEDKNTVSSTAVTPETPSDSEEDKPRKYISSALTDETRQPILNRIKQVFEDESLFCQDNFTLQTLAQLCDTNPRYASQIINETMGMNFASLLNEKRINVACRRLMDAQNYGNLTIEAIVHDLGFKSRSTFSKTFKRQTGMTPGEFQRMAKDKDSGLPI